MPFHDASRIDDRPDADRPGAPGGNQGELLLSRRYVGPPGRQTHLLEAGVKTDEAPLWCLHATAYSGRSFTPFLQAMALKRRVAAPDTPGYGASDPPPTPWTIGEYAESLDQALDAAGEAAVDLLGYHTGAIVAVELARRRPDRIRRLVLIGVPYLSAAEQSDWRRRLAAPAQLTDRLDQFQERWDYFIKDRDPGVSLTRGFENFVDELRAYPHGWWAHEAAFTFDVACAFAQVRQPVLVLNPDNRLSGASRRAAEALAGAEIVETPHLQNAVFDNAPLELAVLTDAFLRQRHVSGQKEGAVRSR
jgi:pimeloyl-ACP methyl ester carboxylesterase